jgi:hypothetical protein
MAAAMWRVWEEEDTDAPLVETEDPAKAAAVAVERAKAGDLVTLEGLDGAEFYWQAGRWHAKDGEDEVPAELLTIGTHDG